MIGYVDASALVKRYVRESWSAEIGKFLSSGNHATSRYSEIEVVSALSRRCREGSITPQVLEQLARQVALDLRFFYVIDLSHEVSTLACALLKRHPLRAGDALHLASGIHLREKSGIDVQFVSFDEKLNAAVQTEGLALPDLSAC